MKVSHTILLLVILIVGHCQLNQPKEIMGNLLQKSEIKLNEIFNFVKDVEQITDQNTKSSPKQQPLSLLNVKSSQFNLSQILQKLLNNLFKKSQQLRQHVNYKINQNLQDLNSYLKKQQTKNKRRNLQQAKAIDPVNIQKVPQIKKVDTKQVKQQVNKNKDNQQVKVINVSQVTQVSRPSQASQAPAVPSPQNVPIVQNPQKIQKVNKNQDINIELLHNENNNNSQVVTCGRQVRIPLTQTKLTTQNYRHQMVQTKHGFNMYVDRIDGSVSSLIRNTGTWEPHFISLIGHIIKPGFNVLNLGSQTGLQALVMGKLIGKTGKLFIFQPYSISNKIVTANIELNNLQNITTIYKVGASDQKGIGTMAIEYSNTGGSQITPTRNTNNTNLPKPTGRYQQVQAVVLDRVDALLPPNIQIDFALLDVQKMQVKALKGMKEVISRSPNMVLMVQWLYKNNTMKTEQQTRELLNFFIEKNYKFYLYQGNGYRDCSTGVFRQYTKIQDLFNFPGEYVDLFFIPGKFKVPV